MTLKNRKLEKEENEQKKLRKKIQQSYQKIKNFKGKRKQIELRIIHQKFMR